MGAVDATAGAAASAGRGSSGLLSMRPGHATGREAAAEAIDESCPGGLTRNTCPTSIKLGFSRPLHRAMSRQFWPWSRPMRIKVSPGLTV
jgi:hypothetical protein